MILLTPEDFDVRILVQQRDTTLLKSEYKHNIVIATHNWITIHISLPFPAPCELFQDVWHPQSQGSNAQVEASSSVLLSLKFILLIIQFSYPVLSHLYPFPMLILLTQEDIYAFLINSGKNHCINQSTQLIQEVTKTKATYFVLR